mgnify:CR=1 FL=1
MKNTEKTMDKIVALCKNRGFVFAGSEIYGGLANTWDYGPLGVELKNNVKKGVVEEVRSGESLQRGAGRRHPHEPPDLGGQRPSVRLLRSSDGLPGVQGAVPGGQAHEDWCGENSVELPKPIDASPSRR